MKKKNECNAAVAFSLILSDITGKDYVLINSPDEHNRSTPDIDYVFRVESEPESFVAAEHTIIESFERQIEYVNRSFDIVSEINQRCQKAIPMDKYFFLAVPDSLVNSLNRTARNAFVAEISPRIIKECAQMKIDENRKIFFNDYEIWLMCNGDSSKMNGNVFRIPKAPDKGKVLQRHRLSRSLIEKLPKLCKYKLKGFSTALLLEDVSGSLRFDGFYGNSIRLFYRLVISLFVDYVVVFDSNAGRMVVGNLWKNKKLWYKETPCPKRYHFRNKSDGSVEKIQKIYI